MKTWRSEVGRRSEAGMFKDCWNLAGRVVTGVKLLLMVDFLTWQLEWGCPGWLSFTPCELIRSNLSFGTLVKPQCFFLYLEYENNIFLICWLLFFYSLSQTIRDYKELFRSLPAEVWLSNSVVIYVPLEIFKKWFIE